MSFGCPHLPGFVRTNFLDLKVQQEQMLAGVQECFPVLKKICTLSCHYLSLLWSFTSLYLVLRFFTLERHCFQSRWCPCSFIFCAIFSYTALFLTAPSNSSCILLSLHIARRLFTSRSVQLAITGYLVVGLSGLCLLQSGLSVYTQAHISKSPWKRFQSTSGSGFAEVVCKSI